MFIPDPTFLSFSHPVSRVEKILDSRIRICIKEFEYFEPIKEKLISKFSKIRFGMFILSPGSWLWFVFHPENKKALDPGSLIGICNTEHK
jgi:hypothetical protein